MSKSNFHNPTIETLESRIAPASLNAALNVLTYKDLQGDSVKISFSHPVASGDFTFNNAFASTGDQQLQLIDIDGQTALNGINIAVSVTHAPGGDGLAAIGAINAAGVNLGKVTIPGDIGQIDAAAISTLSVQSIGLYGTATQAAGAPSLTSTITGGIGKLKVANDIQGADIEITGAISLLSVGGGLNSGAEVSASGTITAAHIGGSISGGSDLDGSSITSVKVGADVRGEISANTIGTVKIGGSDIGGGISGTTSVGAVTIAHDLNENGRIESSSGTIASLKIGGGISDRAYISGDTGVGPVTVGLDVTDGGYILSSAGTIGAVKIGGSLTGEYNSSTKSYISGDEGVGPVTIGGDLSYYGEILSPGGIVSSVKIAGSVSETAKITADAIGNVTVGNDLRGEVTSEVGAIGAVKVGAGLYDAKITSETNIGPITVGGSVDDALIVAGISGTPTAITIGAIKVGGSWIQSSVTAGVTEGVSDNGYGNANDVLYATTSNIASIDIAGAVVGATSGDSTYGFDSQTIGSFKLDGFKIALPVGTGSVILSPETGGNVAIELI